MISSVLTAPRRLSLIEGPDPIPTGSDVLIEVAACGVCGTDRHIYSGSYRVELPLVMGHEYAGTVVDIGPAVGRLRVGDRVAVDPNIVDDVCFYCRRGLHHLCAGLTPLGVVRPGGFATLSLVPERYAHPVPATVELADAALAEPLACCLHGIQQARIAVGDLVAILGAGPIGCMLLQLARSEGAANVFVVEPNPARRARAVALGADEAFESATTLSSRLTEIRGDVGADIVIEASGHAPSAEAAARLARRGGTVVLFGVYAWNSTATLSPFRINEDELRIVGSFNNPNTHQTALSLLEHHAIDTKSLITDELELADVAAAMKPSNFPRAAKILIRPAP